MNPGIDMPVPCFDYWAAFFSHFMLMCAFFCGAIVLGAFAVVIVVGAVCLVCGGINDLFS